MSGAQGEAPPGARARSFSTTATGRAAARGASSKRRSPRALLPHHSDHKGDFDAFKVGFTVLASPVLHNGGLQPSLL